MSLLMDALRKAEESKKKVAQGQKSEAAVEKAARATSKAAAIAKVGKSKSSSGAKKSGNIATTSASTKAGALSPEAKSKSEAAAVPRQYKPKPKLELEAMSEANPASKPGLRSKSKANSKVEAKPKPVTGARPPAKSTVNSEPAASSTVRLDADAIARSAEIAKEIVEAEDRAKDKTRDKAKLQSRNTDRSSAKALFAAKRQQQTQGKRLQLLGLGIVAILATGTAATFYVLPRLGNEPGIAEGSGLEAGRAEAVAPETALAGQDALVEITSSVVVETPPVDEVNPVLSDQDFLSSSSQIISQVIGVIPATDVVIERATEVEPALVDVAPATDALVASSDSGLGSVAVVTELPDAVYIDPGVTIASNDASAPALLAADLEPTRLISFSRQEVISSIDPLLSDAYAAYRRGSTDEAERLYRQLLSSSPQHRDALLGLIAIATMNEETGVAMDFYSRLLARDPSDPVARAGLLELMPSGSVNEQEREFKRLVDRHPEVATLVYALGNFYSSVGRWTNAQQAYYRALQLAKTDAVQSGSMNPDYAFNLAISLEHLNQTQAAQSYYLQALEFASTHPAGFDVAVARSRLENMRGTTTR